jgi:hypothetical protein
MDELNEHLDTFDAQIRQLGAFHENLIEHLDAISGPNRWMAKVIPAEIGLGLTPFPNLQCTRPK